ncbi:MAG: hypothetical protein ACR2GQ_08995 [Gemmatimonadota bacterium]
MPSEPGILERLRELERASAPLEPDAAERGRLMTATDAIVQRYLGAIGTSEAFVEVPEPAAGLLELPISADGVSIEAALESLERDVLRPGGHPASGRHLAYLTGGGLYHSALGDYSGRSATSIRGSSSRGRAPCGWRTCSSAGPQTSSAIPRRRRVTSLRAAASPTSPRS